MKLQTIKARACARIEHRSPWTHHRLPPRFGNKVWREMSKAAMNAGNRVNRVRFPGVKHAYWALDKTGNPVPVEGLGDWADWMERARRTGEMIVARTTLEHVWVSTVFLGLDHSFTLNGPPILFETMVFWNGGPAGAPVTDHDGNEIFGRYATRAEAQAAHEKAVVAAKLLEAALAGEAQTEVTELLERLKEGT